MIHPLKAASSFDCDGCGHHASFHRMESKADEEVARRWRVEEEAREGQGGFGGVEDGWGGGGGGKRRRIGGESGEVVVLEGGSEVSAAGGGRKRRGRGA